MKKLFSLFAAILFVGSMWATETPAVTLDFTDTGWGFPTDAYVTTEHSYTNGGNTITIGANNDGHKALLVNTSDPSQGIKSLIVGKKDATLTFPAMSFNVSKIVIKGEGGASGKVTFNIFVGDDAVSTEATSSKVNHEFPIAAAKQAAGTVYVFKVTNANNSQITSVEFYEAETCNTEVAITKGTETNGTFTLSATSVCADGDGGEIEVSEIEAADGYRFKEITTSASGTVNNTTKKVTGIKAATTITAVFEEIPKYTVSFSTGTGNPTQASITETVSGEGITLPAGPTPACSTDGWSFAGWAEAEVGSKTDVAPTLLSGTYHPADNITLYAVYKKNEGTPFEGYTKVTGAPADWSGKYLLSTGTYTANGAYDNNNHLPVTSYAPSTEEKTEYEFTLTKVADGEYSILLPDGETYIGYNTSTNFKKTKTEPTADDDSFLWAPSDSQITNVGTPARKLMTNGATPSDIRPYSSTPSGGAAILLYKRGAGGSHYYYLSAPTCGGGTALEDVEDSVKSVKFIQNGQLFIEKNGHIYNAMGQMVK